MSRREETEPKEEEEEEHFSRLTRREVNEHRPLTMNMREMCRVSQEAIPVEQRQRLGAFLLLFVFLFLLRLVSFRLTRRLIILDLAFVQTIQIVVLVGVAVNNILDAVQRNVQTVWQARCDMLTMGNSM